MKYYFIAMLVVTIFVTLFLNGCSTLSTLQTIADVTAAAVPILQDVGVPIPAQVVAYVGDVANCIAAQTADPTPVQLVQIGTCLASQILPALDPNLPPYVTSIINTIAKDIEAYVSKYPPGLKVSRAAPATLHFNPTDTVKFLSIRAKARDTVEKCQRLALKIHVQQTDAPHHMPGRK